RRQRARQGARGDAEQGDGPVAGAGNRGETTFRVEPVIRDGGPRCRMEFDCQTCGACCASPFEGEGYIPLERDEELRFLSLKLPMLEIIAKPLEDRTVLLGTHLNSQRRRVCAGFAGNVGGRCACLIYP